MTDRKDLRMLHTDHVEASTPKVSPLTYASERLERLLAELHGLHDNLAERLGPVLDDPRGDINLAEDGDSPSPKGGSQHVRYLGQHGDGLAFEIRKVRDLLDRLEV